MTARSPALVVIACGKSKIWDDQPDAGPTAARDAYTGGPFLAHRAYAQARGDWAVLSARHGFLLPGDLVPEAYDVTFAAPGRLQEGRPAGITALMHQVKRLGLNLYPDVEVLGGAGYRDACEKAFLGTDCWLTFPFAGLNLGREKSAVMAATAKLLAARAA